MNLTAKLLLSAATVAILSTGAMAADLSRPMKSAPMMAAPEAPAGNWDGLYIGANVGYGWGTASRTVPPATAVTTVSTNGWLVGGQIGYNFHVADSLVLGLQGDLDWTNAANTTSTFAYTQGFSGALVARLGLDLGQWMPYVEAGVAFANATSNSPSVSTTQTGWTAGAGVQVMLADNVSADLEYRHNSYGAGTFGNNSTSYADDQIRVGLNYHF